MEDEYIKEVARMLKGKWNEFVEAVGGKEIVCYGAGVNALWMIRNEHFQQFLPQVKFFVDKDLCKEGHKIKCEKAEFEIYQPSILDNLKENCVVIITLSDYVLVGKLLSQKGIEWYSWTVVTSVFAFKDFSVNNDKIKYFLLNTPDYINLGDQAITVAEDIYIRENFGNYYELGNHVCHPEALTYLKSFVSDDDILFFQGGGNLGSLWRVNEEIFRDVLKKFPRNKIVVFPQSIYYGDSEEEQEYFTLSQEIYNSHTDLMICVRDRRSYELVSQSYSCKCMLLPDMVLTLDKNLSFTRKGVGVLLRHDKEQRLVDNYNEVITTAIHKVNEDIVPLTHHPTEMNVDRYERVDTILKQYASCKLVITDRLHGMIFSAITNTPCIAFDNSYHKVSNVYKMWLSDYEHISFANVLTEGELTELVKEKINRNYPLYNAKWYMDKFADLTEYIKYKSEE